MNRGSSELRLDIPSESVWSSLVAGGLRPWYFQLAPKGTFAVGETIRWLDSRGRVAEESEVVDIEPGKRLGLKTRFLFTPTIAAQAQHSMTWDVRPEGGGCVVVLSWTGTELIARMLASEADAILEGLRLVHDPAARAELARLPNVGTIEVLDVTPDRVADYQDFFDNRAFRDFPAWRSCYCMESHRTQDDEAWAVRTREDNRRDMTALITEGQVTALLAYSEGKPVGWCNYGHTTKMAGVMRRFKLDPADHEGVGSISCFVIASPYRRHGVASRLLDEALPRMRALGIASVEAYPVKNADLPQANYRGPLAMYMRAGFTPYREHGPYQIVRKTL